MSENRRKRMSLDDYRKELLNKTINWLTILDVFKKDNQGRTLCMCVCQCGKIIEIEAKRIIDGKLISCGCYKHSDEFRNNLSNWFVNNPDKIKLRSKAYLETVNNKADYFSKRAVSYSETYRKYRAEAFSNKHYGALIHQDDLPRLLHGDLICSDYVRTKCPSCGKYAPHILHTVLSVSTGQLINELPPLCQSCYANLSSSRYETEIAEFISTFYNGTLIRNDRSAIAPKELDLFYPEKSIAIEFNGDYWHSSDRVEITYHYDKFILCRSKDIILVSIFESYWNNQKESIKNYIRDLFNEKENDLSFNEDRTLMNNNYPSPIRNDLHESTEDYYEFGGTKVYTCGFSKLLH